MPLGTPNLKVNTSPPARGAWIEITAEQKLHGLSLVAPRTGGVD